MKFTFAEVTSQILFWRTDDDFARQYGYTQEPKALAPQPSVLTSQFYVEKSTVTLVYLLFTLS